MTCEKESGSLGDKAAFRRSSLRDITAARMIGSRFNSECGEVRHGSLEGTELRTKHVDETGI